MKNKSVLKSTKAINSKSYKKVESNAQAEHPDHAAHISRLNRIKGQILGIEKMIIDKRYCPDIITQLKAATSALKAVEAEIFKTHLRSCVKQAFSTENSIKNEQKIQEIIKLIY